MCHARFRSPGGLRYYLSGRFEAWCALIFDLDLLVRIETCSIERVCRTADSRVDYCRSLFVAQPQLMKKFVWLAPRLCWVALLVLLLVWMWSTQGRSSHGNREVQRTLNLHYVFMTVAWYAIHLKSPMKQTPRHVEFYA